jgi:agmatine deiminase
VCEPPPSLVAASPDWSPATRLFIGWPSRPDVWRDDAAPARAALNAFARAAAAHVPVTVVADTRFRAYHMATDEFGDGEFAGGPGVSVLGVDMDDCWLRDTGPIYRFYRSATRGEVVEAVSYDFNAWGGVAEGCYSDFERDRGVGRALARAGELACMRPEHVLEGGSVSCDGRGTLVTTEECLLHGNRNKGVTKEMLESSFRSHLGVSTVIWLPFGVAGDDDTNGHVDNMCVFIGPGHVVLHWADAADDPEQHRRSSAALRILQSAQDADGNALTIHLVRAPQVPIIRSAQEANGVARNAAASANSAKRRPAGEKLAASYINFIFAGNTVLVPGFGASAADDERARREIEAAVQAAQRPFGRTFTAISIPAREFILSGGNMHCLTVSQPRG